MNNEILDFTKEEIETLLAKDDQSIREHLKTISHAADINEFFRQVDIEQWPRLLALIENDDARAQVVSHFDREELRKLLPLLSPTEIANIVVELDTDDAADILADVPLPDRFDALRMLDQEERAQVTQLLRYPEDSAGGIMQLELAMVQEDAKVSDAIKIVRGLVEDDVEVLNVLVVDHNNRLVGNLALVDLLLNKDTTKVSDIMETDLVFVKPLLDQEEVATIFKKYDLITIPVVDESSRVLGQIIIDDVMDVVAEEAEEDAMHMAGTSAEELLHQSEVLKTARVRLPWLGVALLCSLTSGFLLKFFDSTFEKASIVVSFLPVIMAMGGNVGTQSSTLLIRGFGTGKFHLEDIWTFFFKEVRVAMLIGATYGLFAGLVGFLFLTNYNIYLGLVVFISMICSMSIAALLGVVAPSLLKRLNIDPAIASGPFVTTLNDITGIIIYMTFATFFLTQLQLG